MSKLAVPIRRITVARTFYACAFGVAIAIALSTSVVVLAVAPGPQQVLAAILCPVSGLLGASVSLIRGYRCSDDTLDRWLFASFGASLTFPAALLLTGLNGQEQANIGVALSVALTYLVGSIGGWWLYRPSYNWH